MKRNKDKVEVDNFLKCMFCDRPSYQAGRFISNNMNMIQIICREHFLKLLDSQAGISLEEFVFREEEARAKE